MKQIKRRGALKIGSVATENSQDVTPNVNLMPKFDFNNIRKQNGTANSIDTAQMRDIMQARPGVTYSELIKTGTNKYENTVISKAESVYHASRMTK